MPEEEVKQGQQHGASEMSEERKEGEKLIWVQPSASRSRELERSSSSDGTRRNYAQWLQDLRPELRHIKRTQEKKFNSFVADISPLEVENQQQEGPNGVSFDEHFERVQPPTQTDAKVTVLKPK